MQNKKTGTMIQRIQSVYLFLASMACVAGMSMGIGRFYTEEGEQVGRLFNLWMSMPDGQKTLFPWALFIILLVCATLLLANIFLYKRRVLQLRISLFCLLILVGWYAVYATFAWMKMESMQALFRPEWPAAFPAIAIVLIWLAKRGIMRDILLLKSLDRLR